jgi:hypothetical protein
MAIKVYLDTEFYDNGDKIDLISVGAVAESGQQFYLVSKEARLDLVDTWVREHVVQQLPDRSIYPEQWVSRRDLAEALADFVAEAYKAGGGRPELVLWYGAYDWVALCQLYGGMTKLPGEWPRFYTDLKWEANQAGDPPIPKTAAPAHDALADALWLMTADRYLQGYRAGAKAARKAAKHRDK